MLESELAAQQHAPPIDRDGIAPTACETCMTAPGMLMLALRNRQSGLPWAITAVSISRRTLPRARPYLASATLATVWIRLAAWEFVTVRLMRMSVGVTSRP